MDKNKNIIIMFGLFALLVIIQFFYYKEGNMANLDQIQLPDGSSYNIKDNISGYATERYVEDAIDGITKASIGLGNVDNTSDLNKPVSTATQTSLNTKTNNTMVANVETTTTATQRYEKGDYFIYNGILYEATSIIANGATITVGTNCKVSDKITTLIQNAVKNSKERKYIFVGDSYSAGTYGATGWIDLVNSILGLTSGVDSFDARGISQYYGGSFSAGTFKDQLTDVLTIIDAPEEITDIYVFAGQNEYTYTDNVCLNKIAEFISYANTNFPNAKVHLGFIGRGSDPQYFDAMNAKCRCYIQGAMENGADYVNNIEYVNRMYSDYNADKIHPNSYTEIANYIALGIVNGSVDVQRTKTYNVSATSNATGTISIIFTQSNELIMVTVAVVLSSFSTDIVSGGALSGTKLADVDFDIVGQNFEIPFMANVRSAQSQFSNEYLIIVRSGSDLKIKCNKLIASGWQNIPAPANVSNLNITRDTYSAMDM